MVLFQLPGKDVIMPQVFRCIDFKQDIAKLLLK